MICLPGVTVLASALLCSDRRVPEASAPSTSPLLGGIGAAGGPVGSGGSVGVGGIGLSVMTVVPVVSRFGCGSGVGSGWSPLTVVTFRSTVPPTVPAGTVAVMVTVSDEPAATLGAVHTTEPVDPTAGVVHVSGDRHCGSRT